MGGEIAADELACIRELVLEWARSWGVVRPVNVRVVSTTQATAAGYLNPGVSSLSVSCYLVTLEGDFELVLPSGSRKRGSWAALRIDQARPCVRGFTVRPSDWIPKAPLETLGTVHAIDCE